MNAGGPVVRTGLAAGAVSSTLVSRLEHGWQVASAAPGALASPAALAAATLDWRTAVVPGTVAQAVGPSDPDAHESYDGLAWWYRCTFGGPPRGPQSRVRLRFDGLATLAAVWLNGEPLLESTNMFLAHAVDVTDRIRAENELVIVFRSVAEALAQKRPRPRWKTKLVAHQQLRWIRTTLVGRIPGWTPKIEPVGPWRPVWMEVVSGPDPIELDVRTDVTEGVGIVRIDARLAHPHTGARVRAASVHVGGTSFTLDVESSDGAARVQGEARVPDAALWWPRTHGEPALYPCVLELDTPDGRAHVDLGSVGFRHVRLDDSRGNVRLVVNGEPIFCRGACWTPHDVVSLTGPEEDVKRTLELVADGNANMVRVGGTMVYESDAFYRACDELGLMVWQDLMFANMDYPVADQEFRRSIEAEADQQLRRLQRHPCVVALCGGSEVEQQAAMFGAPREAWTNDFFSETVPRAVAERLGADVPYWTSTPTGGALPFHVSEGIAHYFGVGAYLRPLEDVRTAGVKLTTECLGFSNVPEPENLQVYGKTPADALHHPQWKRGVPKDSGTTWDFEDVRDHYLRLVCGVDPAELRERDPDCYLSLSRDVTGHVMARVFDEWRSPENPCAGGLVWFLKDLRPGAGWGILDSDGRPKPVYQHLKRAWAPVRVALLDRGLDGLRVEVHNETAQGVAGSLEVVFYNANSVVVAKAAKDVTVPARGVHAESVDAMIGYFTDSTYSYRFGPPPHAAVVGRFRAIARAVPQTMYGTGGTLPTSSELRLSERSE